MTRAEEIADLKAKLAISKGKPGLAERVAAIQARLAELEAENGS